MLTHTQPLDEDVRGIDWSPDGKLVSVADMKGKIMLMDPSKLTIIDSMSSSFNKKNQWIEDIKFSPNN